MRITGGKARGIPLKAPKGGTTRPATDRMREAIFSSLGPCVKGSQVIDLFAGTGAYGLEAISRGAVKVDFYETDRNALTCLKQNCQAVLKSCDFEDNIVNIFARDVYAGTTGSEKAELIFIDPPYAEIETQLEQIFQKADQYATEDASVILELPGALEPKPEDWQLVRRFGKLQRDTPSAAIFKRRR